MKYFNNIKHSNNNKMINLKNLFQKYQKKIVIVKRKNRKEKKHVIHKNFD